jgi:23S rRNA pseudouridine2457 synthase
MLHSHAMFSKFLAGINGESIAFDVGRRDSWLKNRAFQYIVFNKPYGVLCQFTGLIGRKTLADYGPFPQNVYPVGRLDADSEGLVLLSNDGRFKHFLLDPRFQHPRTYLVQVERVPRENALQKLRNGIVIEGRATRPADVRLLDQEPTLPQRPVSIRFRKNVPTAWLELTLREGRNRQVRRMTAAVGHPTLRLVRTSIGSLTLGLLRPGKHRELLSSEVAELQRTVLTDHS